MKRKSVRIQAAKAKPQQLEEEERNTLITNMMSTSLFSLPPELVVMVASNLDVSSYLAFASSSKVFLDILVSQLQWNALLQRTKMNNEEFDVCESFGETEEKDEERKVRELALFLKFQKDADGQLLLALLHTICQRFPTQYLFGPESALASVSCPCRAIHQVSLCGFALLEQAELIVRGPGAEPQQKLIECKGLGVKHLEEFASRALRQKQKVAKLEVSTAKGPWRSQKEPFELLKRCKLWEIDICWVGDSSFMLGGIAKEAARGSIGGVFIYDKAIADSKIAHLKKVWEITKRAWLLRCSDCTQSNMSMGIVMADEGWTKMLTVIKNIQTKKHDHYKMCKAVLIE